MSKNLEQYSKLRNEWNKKWKNEVADIFIFGSAIKGKLKPNDIDICLVFNKNPDVKIIKQVQEFLGDKYHVSSISVENFFTKPHSLIKTLLLEGKSIISNKTFTENFGLESQLLYSYDISKLDSSKKVMFVYLLRGRKGEKGIITQNKGEFISNNAFIISIEKDNEIQEIFAKWGVPYKRKKIFLMS